MFNAANFEMFNAAYPPSVHHCAESKRLAMLIENTLLTEFELPNFWIRKGCRKFKILRDLEEYGNEHRHLGPIFRFFGQDRYIPIDRIESACSNPLWVPEEDEDLADLYDARDEAKHDNFERRLDEVHKELAVTKKQNNEMQNTLEDMLKVVI